MKKLAALLPFLLVTAGMAQDVNYNFAKGTNFSAFKTYKWVPMRGEQVDEITANQLKSAIEAELTTKGLTNSNSDDADLLIGLQVATQHEQSMTYYDNGWGWRGGGFSTATTETILVGSFVLDMYDRANKQLVWRGTATKTIDTGAKPDKREKNIAKGAKKLLKNYPPPAK